jgi:hypothetical protein
MTIIRGGAAKLVRLHSIDGPEIITGPWLMLQTWVDMSNEMIHFQTSLSNLSYPGVSDRKMPFYP